jgi:hypothetical protein
MLKDAGVDTWIHYLLLMVKKSREWPGTKCSATTGIIVVITCEDAKKIFKRL